VGRVVQRLDAEAITGGEECVVAAVSEHEGELAPQVAQAGSALVFIEVQGDLAIGAGAEAVAPAFEVALRALKVVELAVDDDLERLILAGDRLIAGRQVDDAELGMAQPDPTILGEPRPLSVRPPVGESEGRSLQSVGPNRLPRRLHCYDTTHTVSPFLEMRPDAELLLPEPARDVEGFPDAFALKSLRHCFPPSLNGWRLLDHYRAFFLLC
jgi:hypothetical protein